MKKLSLKFLLSLSFLFVIVTAIAFYIFGINGTRILLQKSSAESTVNNTTSTSSYQTDGKEEEVPHFNLFSIINKFIPH